MSENPSTPHDAPRAEGEPRFSFTDKRKVNPMDGEVRPSGAPAPSESPAADAEGTVPPAGDAPISGEPVDGGEQWTQDAPADQQASDASARIAELEAQIAQLTEQSKRDQAEYVNSRRRIEAGAEASRQQAIAGVLVSLLSVLDDIELGRQHGDIAEGTPFQAITQKLEDALATHGLERFGEVGEPFDPTLHEALMHQAEDDVESPEIAMVMQPGYRMHERVLRPARVGTKGPA